MFAVSLALLLQLVLQGGDTGAQLRYERIAIRWRLAGVLSVSCRVLAGVQEDPHSAVRVLLMGDRAPLDALSNSVDGRAEEFGGFPNASTPS